MGHGAAVHAHPTNHRRWGGITVHAPLERTHQSQHTREAKSPEWRGTVVQRRISRKHARARCSTRLPSVQMGPWVRRRIYMMGGGGIWMSTTATPLLHHHHHHSLS